MVLHTSAIFTPSSVTSASVHSVPTEPDLHPYQIVHREDIRLLDEFLLDLTIWREFTIDTLGEPLLQFPTGNRRQLETKVITLLEALCTDAAKYFRPSGKAAIPPPIGVRTRFP